jgi:glycosyltransferase involved in cell wall biosynthesis
MKKPSLSVVLATYNEEKNIGRCLRSVKNLASEIIIVDGSSTDKTREIAKQFDAKIKKIKNIPMFHSMKQQAVDLATKDWILQLDADEEVTPALKEEIIKTIDFSPAEKGFYLPRKNLFLSHWLKKGGQYPDPVIRLFKRGHGRFPQKSVHEQIKIKGSVGHLQSPLLHHFAPTLTKYLINTNRYTSLEAKKLRGNKFTLLLKYGFYLPLKTFFSLYFRHRGYVDGLPGFLFALLSAWHHPIIWAKFIENS